MGQLKPSPSRNEPRLVSPQKLTWAKAVRQGGSIFTQFKQRPLLASLGCVGVIGAASLLTSAVLLGSWKSVERQTLMHDMVQARYILESQARHPGKKAGEKNDVDSLTTITKNLQLKSLKIYPSTQIPPQFKEVYQKLLRSPHVFPEVKTSGWATISGYGLLTSSSAKSPALIEVQQPRTLWQQGLRNILILNVCVVGVGSLLTWAVFLKLRRSEQLRLEQEQITQALMKENKFALFTLQSIREAVITTDAYGKIKMLNPMAEKLTGWTAKDAMGCPLQEVFSVEDDDSSMFIKLPLSKILQEGVDITSSETQGSHSLISRDGRRASVDYSVTRIWDENDSVQGVVVVFRDVTTHRNMARLLAWQANFDALTGLVNRREFERRLEQALQEATAQQAEHSLCFIDLDHFKAVNDNAGHPAGDELLRQISALLRQYVRRSDLVARLGGDEFGAILYHCSIAEGEAIAKEICRRVKEFRFVWQDQVFKIGASIGLVAITAESSESNQLFNLVDAACYAAKNQGRGRVCIYQPSMQELIHQKAESLWIQRINRALSEDQFCLFSQVMAPLHTERDSGEHYEVLLRMMDEQGNIVVPDMFMPAAERYNLMPAIDRWVVTKLFSTQASRYQESWNRWQNQGVESLYSINLSVASINDPEFVKFLLEQFRIYNIPPKLVCFEIKETVAVTNLSRINKFVEPLKNIGCRFALDDFGSGMSSFAYLKNLPIDFLKIDGSLIRDIDNPSTFATIESITRISTVMEMKTIAEFVTSTGIANRCAAAGIDYGQGYGLGRPRLLVGLASPISGPLSRSIAGT